jgi:hypothetical protein
MGDARRSAEGDRARHIGWCNALAAARLTARRAHLRPTLQCHRLMQFVAWVERQRRRLFSWSLNRGGSQVISSHAPTMMIATARAITESLINAICFRDIMEARWFGSTPGCLDFYDPDVVSAPLLNGQADSFRSFFQIPDATTLLHAVEQRLVRIGGGPSALIDTSSIDAEPPHCYDPHALIGFRAHSGRCPSVSFADEVPLVETGLIIVSALV